MRSRRSAARYLGAYLACIVGVAAATTSRPTEALAADPKQACIDANAAAQVAEREGQFRDAYRDLLSCAGEACPPVIRKDCSRMLSELSDRQPTIIIEARDASGREVSVRTFLDGVALAATVEGLEVPVDPGRHTLRFVPENGPAVEQHLTFREAEKRRRIAVELPRAPAAAAEQVEPRPRVTPVLAYALLGIGTAAAASFGYFAVRGIDGETRLAGSCAPRCSQSDIDDVRGHYVAADVSLAVLLAAVGGAVLVGWLSRTAPARATAPTEPR